MKRLAACSRSLAGIDGSGSTILRFTDRSRFKGRGSTLPVALRVGVLKPAAATPSPTMPMETYVARVLAGEAVRDSQPAALEALAITIRTFALANRGRHRADGFDLCDQTHCQVLRAAVAATERAAQATAGRVLLRDGAPASIYYSASCGGRTQMPSDVWPGAEDPPFLPSKDDDACQGAPAWTAELHESDLRARAAGGRFPRRAARRQHRVAERVGARRAAEARRAEAGSDLRSGLSRRGRADARLAARQEHGVRSAARRTGRTGSAVTGPVTASACASSDRRASPSAASAPKPSLRAIFPVSRSRRPCRREGLTGVRPGSDPDPEPAKTRPKNRLFWRLAKQGSDPGLTLESDASWHRIGAGSGDVLLSLPDDDEGERDAHR